MTAQPKTIRAAIERTQRYINAGCAGQVCGPKEASIEFENTLLVKMRKALEATNDPR